MLCVIIRNIYLTFEKDILQNIIENKQHDDYSDDMGAVIMNLDVYIVGY
jgi:hypothetical protein